ncbi:MAG TPA: patatin-like phospholipase family protein [Candidatus Polarisedimenticolaceae bacterium]|nr:patatin-like phospholipase family protein [Candidatus Polarisedimenticolaceae bacterium]
MRRSILAALAACAVFSNGIADEPPAHRPKVVLVLSGGGARGSAHIGVLKVLEEYHVPVDMIVGTSMGSIVGGLYASGWTSKEIEDQIITINWGGVFNDRLTRQEMTFRRKDEQSRFLIPIKLRFRDWKPYIPPAVIGGQNLELLFQGLEIQTTGERDFDKLPIPYRAVASDLATGKAVVLGSGSLSDAMRASMALPGIFPPIILDGRELSDGGMAANFPVRIARALGADVVIGVDITSPLRKKEELGNILTRIDQVTGLLTNANKEADMAAVKPQDIILVPELSDISFSDFDKAEETIGRGENAAHEAEARLRALAVSDEEWQAYVAKHHKRPAADLVVDKVVIKNTGPLNDAIVERRIKIPTGVPLDQPALEKQIQYLYGMDVFGPIGHTFDRTDETGTLTIDVPPKPYSRNSLQFGGFMASDFAGDFQFDLIASHIFNPFNRSGGEWRNILQFGTNTLVSTEYYQPLEPSLAWVFDGKAGYRRDIANFYTDQGDAVAQYVFETTNIGAGFGRVLGRWGELSAGAFRDWGQGRRRIGDDVFPAVSTDDAGFEAQFRVDTLDTITWPRQGTHLNALYRRSLEGMGAQETGDFVKADALQVFELGRNIISIGAEISDLVNGAVTYDNAYELGGLFRLSGLQPNQLVGSRGGIARLMYYRELTRFSLGSLTQRMYAGVSAEAGNVYVEGDPVTVKSLRTAGSLFIGADTVLGPAYIGYGREQSGQNAAYLIIGQRF